jgi:hypothetical protein
MFRWPIPVLLALTLCACQAGSGVPAPRAADAPCPQFGPCDDPDQESWLPPGPATGAEVRFADYHPMFSTCPQTLQVMRSLNRALRHPIVFKAVRPDGDPDTDTDPGDWTCDAPDAPLLRADR